MFEVFPFRFLGTRLRSCRSPRQKHPASLSRHRSCKLRLRDGPTASTIIRSRGKMLSRLLDCIVQAPDLISKKPPDSLHRRDLYGGSVTQNIILDSKQKYPRGTLTAKHTRSPTEPTPLTESLMIFLPQHNSDGMNQIRILVLQPQPRHPNTAAPCPPSTNHSTPAPCPAANTAPAPHAHIIAPTQSAAKRFYLQQRLDEGALSGAVLWMPRKWPGV